jgi:hypothetical protein
MMTDFTFTSIDLYKSWGWNETQIIAISIVQRIMGTISVIGSGYVIQDVLRNPEKRRTSTFHRLMVGLSTADIISSFFSHVLSTSPMPKGYHVLAIGSVATCDIQGFVGMLGCLVTALYNCSLTTYYLVQVRYNWVDRRIKALEKWLHLVPWSVGLVVAIIPLLLQGYGPYGTSCM